MSQFAQVVEQLEEKLHKAPALDYRCRAADCPNAGSIDGLCYWHWREHPQRWVAVSALIRENFSKLRNY